MKKSLIRLMSCILVLGMVLSLSVGSAALADSGETGSSTVDSSGTGTTEDPKITSTTTTSTDGKTGETTIDIEFQKEWAGENAEGKSVEGMETGEVIETTKEITVYLLQAFHCSLRNCVEQIALE